MEKPIKYRIEYRLVSRTIETVTFTASGHPDLEAWDAAEDEENTKVLAVFYDEDAEEKCRHVFEKLNIEHQKMNEESSAPWADYVGVERVVVEEEEDADITWWWKEILGIEGGFNPDDYGWSDTDLFGKKYEWDNDEELVKQVPKVTDFIKVSIEYIENSLEFLASPHDMSAEDAFKMVMSEMESLVKVVYETYNPEDPLDYINVFSEIKKT